jgi:[ribosomal protein S5]-alanine N-acetyltransferase
MERMPYQPSLDVVRSVGTAPPTLPAPVGADWRCALPTLGSAQVVLRELQASDAASLHALLTAAEVSRFISPPPTTVDGFERFIAWTIRQRELGAYVCYAVTLRGFDTAIGIFQVRQLDGAFAIAEWGFALGADFWGTGVFQQGAELVLAFAFDVLGVHRLEARAAVLNGRGNGALVKIGAVREALLRGSLPLNGEFLDQYLYAILRSDRQSPAAHSPRSDRLVH